MEERFSASSFCLASGVRGADIKAVDQCGGTQTVLHFRIRRRLRKILTVSDGREERDTRRLVDALQQQPFAPIFP
jgi:hypothetical protein